MAFLGESWLVQPPWANPLKPPAEFTIYLLEASYLSGKVWYIYCHQEPGLYIQSHLFKYGKHRRLLPPGSPGALTYFSFGNYTVIQRAREGHLFLSSHRAAPGERKVKAKGRARLSAHSALTDPGRPSLVSSESHHLRRSAI